MTNPWRSTSIRERPLAWVPVTLVSAVLVHALVSGCGGKSNQTTNSETSTPATTTPAPSSTPASESTATPAAGATAGGDVAEGKQIYMAKCTPCHGPEGKGNGPLAASLNVKPRNHTDGAYMRSRTDDQLLEVIRNGKPPMPAWKGVLTEPQMHSVLAYVRTLAK